MIHSYPTHSESSRYRFHLRVCYFFCPKKTKQKSLNGSRKKKEGRKRQIEKALCRENQLRDRNSSAWVFSIPSTWHSSVSTGFSFLYFTSILRPHHWFTRLRAAINRDFSWMPYTATQSRFTYLPSNELL